MTRHARPAGRARAIALLLLASTFACAGPDAPTGAASDAAPNAARKPRVTRPGAPQAVAATAGNAQATVTWQAPTSDGNSPILSYRVLRSPGAVSMTVNAPATSATVTGLTNGTSYTFTLYARNSAGEGPASAPSNAVTPTDPNQPPPPPPPPPPPTGRWLSGYYVGYQRALYPPEEVDFSLLTHIFVGRLIPRTDGTLATHFDIDDVNGPAMARTLSARAHQAGRKAVLMLGGAGEHAGFVGAASDANRARFVANLLARMDEYGYDGIDVDWEPVLEADKAPLLALLRALRQARPGMILTIPVGWVNANFAGEVTAWHAEVAQVVDQMNLMTYDMAGPWGGWLTWHHSALQGHAANTPSSVASSIQAYRNVGIPASKLGIGLGFYGACWRGATGPRQTIGSGVSLVASDNVMSYANIMAQYHEAGARRWDDLSKVPYLSFTTGKGPQSCNFVSYDDPESITGKGAWVRANGLGGAIIWTIQQGRLPSTTTGSRDPLLSAAYNAIVP